MLQSVFIVLVQKKERKKTVDQSEKMAELAEGTKAALLAAATTPSDRNLYFI